MMTPASLMTELGVLAVFGTGLLISRLLERRWHPAEIVVMYSLGLLFEILTSHMWEYHNIIFTFPFIIVDDISATFPLGWAGLIMTVTPVAEHLWRRFRIGHWWSRHLVLMLAWLIIGGASEITFHGAGMFEYVRSPETEVNFILGQFPGLPPNMVLLGYGLLQPFVTYFLQWLEKGLAGPGGGKP